MKKAVATAKAPAAIGPYSQATARDGWLFASGQIPLKPDGTLAAGVKEQTEQVLANLAAVLAAGGLGLDDVVKTTVYMTDLSQFAAMNEVYARHFKEPYPARATVQVAALPKGAGVEIDAIACR